MELTEYLYVPCSGLKTRENTQRHMACVRPKDASKQHWRIKICVYKDKWRAEQNSILSSAELKIIRCVIGWHSRA